MANDPRYRFVVRSVCATLGTLLEATALDRALNGVKVRKVFANGHKATVREYDNKLLLAMLKRLDAKQQTNAEARFDDDLDERLALLGAEVFTELQRRGVSADEIPNPEFNGTGDQPRNESGEAAK